MTRFVGLWVLIVAIGGCAGGGSKSIDPYCTRYIGGSAVFAGLKPTALIAPAPSALGVPTDVGIVRITTAADVFQQSPFDLTMTLQPASGSAIVQTIRITTATIARDYTYDFAIPPLTAQMRYDVFVQDSGLCPRSTPTSSLGTFTTK